jgi:hypothetical protein
MRNHLLCVIALAVAAAMLSACGSGNDQGSPYSQGNGNGAAPPPSQQVAHFPNFLEKLVQQGHSGAPVQINQYKLEELAPSNTQAFKDVDFGPVQDPPGLSLATRACRSMPDCHPGIHGPQ